MMPMFIRRACVSPVFMSGLVTRDLWWRISGFVYLVWADTCFFAKHSSSTFISEEYWNERQISKGMPGSNISLQKLCHCTSLSLFATNLPRTWMRHKSSYCEKGDRPIPDLVYIVLPGLYSFRTKVWVSFHFSFLSTVLYIFFLFL
jgi:hypothetical protein